MLKAPVKSLSLLLLIISSTAWADLDPASPTVFITGANRGIGLEFAKQYAAKGWRVIATHRRDKTPETLSALSSAYPDLVVVQRMDVTDHAMIDAVAEKYQGEPIDILLNNAGVVGAIDWQEEQMFGTLDHSLFETFMRTNVQGPLKISEAFLEHVTVSEHKRIIAISSAAGSFGYGAASWPGSTYYKSSKAALNMVMALIATSTKDDGIIVACLSPGTVQVEKLKDYDFPGMIQPEESISNMIRVIEGLTLEDTGSFFQHTGEPLPW